jgi:hypothetical protein
VFQEDVFGESLTSLDAWEVEDKFTNVSPVHRQHRRSWSNSPTNNKSFRHARLKQLKENTDAIDIDF